MGIFSNFQPTIPMLSLPALMKLVGTITVHSILQGGPGLRIFSPAVYHYLATGDIDAAIQKMSFNDCSSRIKAYISMIAEAVDVAALSPDETTDILSECGLTVSLTNDNKMMIIHPL